jgi:hypothetical protein
LQGRKDPRLDEKYPTLSFLEVQERIIKECNRQVLVDAENLLAQSNNKFGLVLEIAEEANEYLRHNKDESLSNCQIHTLRILSHTMIRVYSGAEEVCTVILLKKIYMVKLQFASVQIIIGCLDWHLSQ